MRFRSETAVEMRSSTLVTGDEYVRLLVMILKSDVFSLSVTVLA